MNNAQKSKLSIGIDLGTTNSLIAMLGEQRTPEIIPGRNQEPLTPSVVGLNVGRRGGARYIVGRQAINNARKDPRNTVRSIKRFMGLPFHDPKVQVAKTQVPYELVEDPSEAGKLVVKLGDTLLTPEEISAKVLQQLKEDAEERLGAGSVESVVITVPAYFGEPQRSATRRAGSLAGLRVKALLDEPTAAALSETHGQELQRTRILVFDFGGGTLDISLVQIHERTFQVVSYAGDNFLGGDDVDRALIRRIREHILKEGGNLQGDDYALEYELKKVAEQAKKELASGAEVAPVFIARACRRKDGEPLDVDMELTQDDFADAMVPIERRISEVIEQYLDRETLKPEQLTDVLMVGGSSALPSVKKLLERIFNVDGKARVRLARAPMEAVARGAAIYAGMVQTVLCPACGTPNEPDAQECTECEQSLLMATTATTDEGGTGRDVVSKLPWSLGIRYRSGTDADAFERILEKGNPYPVVEKKEFRISSVDLLDIQIFEGDSPRASENTMISALRFEQIPSDVSPGDRLAVEFAYDRDRTLFITLDFPDSKSRIKPRWQLATPAASDLDDPLKDLTALLPRVRGFLDRYGEFVDKGARLKIEQDLEDASQAVMTSNRQEAERVRKNLFTAMTNSAGVASTLFMAENTMAADDPTYGGAIRQAAAQLREQAQSQDARTESTRNALDGLMMKALSTRAGPNLDGEAARGPALPER
jgi:molecular chaperone DnaK